MERSGTTLEAIEVKITHRHYKCIIMAFICEWLLIMPYGATALQGWAANSNDVLKLGR